MATKLMAKCPYCGESFDRNAGVEGIDWIKNTVQGLGLRNYFHLKCHKLAVDTPKDQWPTYQEKLNEARFWADLCYDYMTRDLKTIPNYTKIVSQLNNFNKSKKMQYEGMYKTLIYCYEIKHLNVDKAEGGIGIVAFEYENARQYFSRQLNLKNNLLDAINKQINERREIVINKKQPNRNRKIKKIDLAEIGEE